MSCHYVIAVRFCLGSWGLPQSISFCSVLKERRSDGHAFWSHSGCFTFFGKAVFYSPGCILYHSYPPPDLQFKLQAFHLHVYTLNIHHPILYDLLCYAQTELSRL